MASFGPAWGIDDMTTEASPEYWQAPEWHEDFGDPRIELEELRSLAIAIRNSVPGVSLQLETPEPGLMELLIDLPNKEIVEVHSIATSLAAEGRRFAIFVSPETTDEIEYYSNSVVDALRFIRERTASHS